MKRRRFETEQRFSMKALYIVRTIIRDKMTLKCEKGTSGKPERGSPSSTRKTWKASLPYRFCPHKTLSHISFEHWRPPGWNNHIYVLIRESTWPDLCKHGPVCSLTRTPGISARLILSSMKVHLAVESPQWQAWSQRGKIGFSMRVNCFLKEFIVGQRILKT